MSGGIVNVLSSVVDVVVELTATVIDIDLAPAIAVLRGEREALDVLHAIYRNASENDRNRVDGLIFQLAGSPATGDSQWGRNHARDHSACAALRLSLALQIVGLQQAQNRHLRFWSAFEDQFCAGDSCRSRIVDVEHVWMQQPTHRYAHCAFGFINGIHMSHAAALDQDVARCAQWLSHDGVAYARVSLVYNGDKRGMQYVEVAAGHRGIATLPALLLLHEWFQFFENAPRAKFLQVSFSGGVTHVAVAMHALPSELQARIAVIAIAPSYFLERELNCEVVHIGKRTDFVPAVARNYERWRSGNPEVAAAGSTNIALAIEHETMGANVHDPHVPEMTHHYRQFVSRFHASNGRSLF